MFLVYLLFFFFFFNDTATTEIYTLSLHDALPISCFFPVGEVERSAKAVPVTLTEATSSEAIPRSEEHTSELQSHLNLVCRLLLEKKKKRFSCLRTHRLPTTFLKLLLSRKTTCRKD